MEPKKELGLEHMLLKADQLIKDKRLEEAHHKLLEIVEIDDKFGKAHNHLGWFYETKVKDYPRAEMHYKKALESMPEHAATYYNYAILLSTLKRYDDLGKLLTKALEIPSINKFTIYNEYGIMFESIEEYDKAIRHYTDAIRYTLDSKSMDKALDSIDRCKRKADIFKGGTY